jgi:hypothetical protein
VAYRAADRWVQRCEPVTLQSVGQGVALRPGGVYLITGGLGGLGLVFAEYLARTVQANLVLVSRISLPPRSNWKDWLPSRDEHDPIAAKIRRIQGCEASGGTVLVASADVTDRKQMRAAIDEARRRFGTIHGVIHAAGMMDDGLVQIKTNESLRAVLAPKVQGTLVLDEVLGDALLDFCALCSSVSSVLVFKATWIIPLPSLSLMHSPRSVRPNAPARRWRSTGACGETWAWRQEWLRRGGAGMSLEAPATDRSKAFS